MNTTHTLELNDEEREILQAARQILKDIYWAEEARFDLKSQRTELHDAFIPDDELIGCAAKLNFLSACGPFEIVLRKSTDENDEDDEGDEDEG